MWSLLVWQPSAVPAPPQGYLDQLLSFVYTLAHWVGGWVVQMISKVVPLADAAQLVDPLGLLVLITAFLIVAEVAKKLAWLVVVVGWALIVVRIALEVTSR